MQNGYHTAKVEWIKDEPILEEELGNLKIIMTFIIRMKQRIIVRNFWKQGKLHFGKEFMLPKLYFSNKVNEVTITQNNNNKIYKILLR